MKKRFIITMFFFFISIGSDSEGDRNGDLGR